MLLSTTTYLLLPAAVLAAPAPVTDISPRGLAIREAEGVGLANTNVRENCFIVNGDPVNCRKGPGLSYPVVTTFGELTEHTFSCYATGSCVEENWYVRHNVGGRTGLLSGILG
jgi:hypothetical protein